MGSGGGSLPLIFLLPLVSTVFKERGYTGWVGLTPEPRHFQGSLESISDIESERVLLPRALAGSNGGYQ